MGTKSCDDWFGLPLGSVNNTESKLGKMKPYPGVIAVVIDALKKKGMRFEEVSLKNGDITYDNKNIVVFRGDTAKVLNRAFHGSPRSVPTHQTLHDMSLLIDGLGCPSWGIDGNVFKCGEIVGHNRSLPRKLSHRRLATRTATAELTAPMAVGSGDLGLMVDSIR
jgi:hypothetical protein